MRHIAHLPRNVFIVVTHFIKSASFWLYYFVDRPKEFTGFGDVTLNIVTEINRKLGANSCVHF